LVGPLSIDEETSVMEDGDGLGDSKRGSRKWYGHAFVEEDSLSDD